MGEGTVTGAGCVDCDVFTHMVGVATANVIFFERAHAHSFAH
jgi:hypothetical protein